MLDKINKKANGVKVELINNDKLLKVTGPKQKVDRTMTFLQQLVNMCRTKCNIDDPYLKTFACLGCSGNTSSKSICCNRRCWCQRRCQARLASTSNRWCWQNDPSWEVALLSLPQQSKLLSKWSNCTCWGAWGKNEGRSLVDRPEERLSLQPTGVLQRRLPPPR